MEVMKLSHILVYKPSCNGRYKKIILLQSLTRSNGNTINSRVI